MYKFSAELKIIGVNPYVSVPEEILENLFKDAGKNKGPIPICGKLENNEYSQTLIKYLGERRLYVNTVMLKNSPKLIGKIINLTFEYDPRPRVFTVHPNLKKILA